MNHFGVIEPVRGLCVDNICDGQNFIFKLSAFRGQFNDCFSFVLCVARQLNQSFFL